MPRNKKGANLNNYEDHSQKAYQGIRRLLYNKELVPGQKIPYRELAERLNMSPTPIIQALKWLEIEGLVLHKPNRGYYMTPFSLQEIEEIYELREIIEPSLLPETVKHLNKEGIKRLKASLDAHLSAERGFYLKERLFKNTDFHLTLASLSGRQTQIRVLRHVFDLLLLKYGGSYMPIGSMDAMDKDHQKTFEYAVSGDIKGAKATLSKHIGNVKKEVLKGFKRVLEEKEEFLFESRADKFGMGIRHTS
ncbi:MAG: GntR family transcriptional regulator [Deltaproteobacteria bacterium]|nr:GntR family transcriptional regulator [Deltaproteobacteria bacterium]